MPIYRYICERCGASRTEIHKMSESPKLKCHVPKCNGGMSRAVARSSFSLKGNGWYKDGYS